MGDHHPLSFLDQHKRDGTTPGTSEGPVPALDACPRRSIERGPQGAGQTKAEPIPEHRPRTSEGGDAVEATWAELERVGRVTGHVVARCPSCTNRAMVSILNSSGTSRWTKSGGGWPKCKQCRSGSAVEPVGDVNLVARVRPGYPPRQSSAGARRKPSADGQSPTTKGAS